MQEDNKQNIKIKTTINLFWRFAERCGAQSVSLVVSIILARLLAPEDYGSIALITVITTILNVFVDSGLGSALIQKKDADDLDFSTVFYFNICFCLVLYVIVCFFAPFISKFYGDTNLTPVLRVLSLTIVISGLKNVQQAYVSKNLMFKKFFFSTLGGTIIAAIVGITMAFCGFGIWALVAQQLVNTSIDTIILWFMVKWRPKKMFSLERLKILYSFGWKLLLSSLINTVYDNIRQLLIGKIYSSADLAYYNRGKQFPNMIGTNINCSIDSVLFPVMSNEGNTPEKMKSMTRRSINISSYVMWPLMLGLASIATPLVSLLLTDKWLMSVPYLQVFCIVYGFQPIHTANLNAIKALGRSDLYLKMEIIKKIIGLIILACAIPFGVYAVACSLLVSAIFTTFINSYPNKKLMSYGYFEQMKDIIPYALLSIIMAACIYPISLLPIPNIITIILKIIAGISVYFTLSVIFGMESFQYIFEIIKNYKKSKN
jgi:O-antigen/teichoic acid export membrane protein